MARKQLGSAPTDGEDAATKEYVDGRGPKTWGPIDAGDATPGGAVAGDVILRRLP
ncbi:hypothetical protein HMPREF0063_10038 [Aeromicrobium marinum DSM 15272]|uniref:Uncharacterized protein n=1 Tax=Aeromicrobium marinum DSM 15272 TaxID=585531 RepID=E2S7N1_9ACTN|nr:hypothetical protein [Aeromicrobium marinum]EFQ84697.1 hypothetical protein HMPREF0063_10038 [Aeromicrobium marinum DSM 15272]